MFKLFKNATIYRLTRKMPNINAAFLRQFMPDNPFVFCTAQECARTGWVMNEDNTPWMLTFKSYILISLRTERRDVPKDAINAELAKRVDEFEQRTGALPRRPEKSALRDEVYQGMLPRAFSKSSYTQILIDTERDLIFVDAASAKSAENALAMLRKTVQSLPVYPVAAATPPELVMTKWLKEDEAPQGVTIGDGRLTFANLHFSNKKASLSNIGQCDATSELLNADNVITSMSLSLETQFGLSLILNNALQLKRLAFSDALKEKAREDAADQVGEQDDALKAVMEEGTFILMTTELLEAWDIVINAMGGEAEWKGKPEDEAASAEPAAK